MIRRIDVVDKVQIQSVLRLQQLAYRLEAALIGYDDLPPLKETAYNLAASGETFYGYFVNNDLAGVVSYKIVGNALDIHRLMVHPDYTRRGMASALLAYVEGLEPTPKRIVVTTASLNTPARRLYEKLGFKLARAFEVGAGLTLIELEKIR